MCMCVHMYTHTYVTSMHVEARGQPVEVSILLPCGFQRLKSAHHDVQQTLLSAESS